MPKIKGPLRKHQQSSSNPYHKPPAPSKSVFKSAHANPHSSTSKKSKKPSTSTQHPRPPLPFNPEDTVLLLGEGNFSFSHSLLESHGVYQMTCTAYDTEEEVYRKYPDAKQTCEKLKEEDQRVLFGVDARKLESVKGLTRGVERGGFARVCWMFPHCGGLSRDLDRQVRANQEMLLAFFKSAKSVLLPDGLVVVTLFASPHYEAWNIKGLAKSQGFRAQRSFKFLAEEFPGYRHARTIGTIEKGKKRRGGQKPKQNEADEQGEKDGQEEKKDEEEKKKEEEGDNDGIIEQGGWKGEEREARMYLFELDDGAVKNAPKKAVKKDPRKIKRGGGLKDPDSSDEE